MDYKYYYYNSFYTINKNVNIDLHLMHSKYIATYDVDTLLNMSMPFNFQVNFGSHIFNVSSDVWYESVCVCV